MALGMCIGLLRAEVRQALAHPSPWRIFPLLLVVGSVSPLCPLMQVECPSRVSRCSLAASADYGALYCVTVNSQDHHTALMAAQAASLGFVPVAIALETDAEV